MTDFVKLNPADFSIDELTTAARGESPSLAPQMAVTLLTAKLGGEARLQLTALTHDPAVDLRARHAAVLALGEFAEARDDLLQLAESPEPLIADAATEALGP